MKEIKAVIRPNKLTALRDALRTVPGFPGMTVTKAEGCSAPARRPGNSIKEELTDYTPKVRLEIVAEDQVAEALFQRIIEVTQTGQVGDGLVWMTDIHKAAFIFKTTPGAEGL
ncbi:P-II family nitrogen regulator [Azospira inquinata]|uniref:P-II family nitrogen regulator n=1 Tax=Azospira inquinata TaxID=2785627 RepID=A0A975XVV0_9RHOO|nr:P-II family nitrogen regulator [Azospira inquinata]QWT47161.1 P-II family nitrogen regulator [Azospira inquinata]QWT50209.1 P-II family nitrogen regulator [Azospira inquinata]